jgi:hypothetical protein
MSGPALSAEGDCNGGPAEGPGNGNVPTRDRDRAIMITAIGVYPDISTIADADLWERATARETRRAFVQIEATVSTAELGLVVDGKITHGSPDAIAVCGAGGISSTVAPAGAGPQRCACGPHHGTVNTIGTCGGQCSAYNTLVPCSGGSNAGAAVTLPAYNDPVVFNPAITPPTTDANWGFPPQIPARSFDGTTAYALGAGTRCEFLFGHSTNVEGVVAALPLPNPAPNNGISVLIAAGAAALDHGFNNDDQIAWIWDSTDDTPLATLQAAGVQVIDENALTDPGLPVVDVGFGPDADNCTTMTTAADVPTPCYWDFDESGSVASPLVFCRPHQSLCWKPVALFDEAATTLNGQLESTNGAGSDEAFQPVSTRIVPYTKGGLTYAAMCGGGVGAISSGKAIQDKGDHWHIDQAVCGSDWPPDHFMLFADMNWGGSRLIHLKDDFGCAASPMRSAIISEGAVEFEKALYACCPTCDCSSFPAGACGTADAAFAAWSTGYLVRAGDWCTFKDGGRGIGDIECQAVMIEDDMECLVADLRATGTDNVQSGWCFNGSGVCVERSICLKQDNYAYDDLNMDQNNSLTGIVYVDNNDTGANDGMWVGQNNTIFGRLLIDNNLVVDKGLKIVWTGGGGAAVSYVIDDRFVYLESSW